MEQRLHIRDLKSPNQSLRSPSTSPNFKSIVLDDDKVPPLLNNFSICEQAKLFVANWNGSVENNHDGYDHKTVSLNVAGVGMKGEKKSFKFNVLCSTIILHASFCNFIL